MKPLYFHEIDTKIREEILGSSASMYALQTAIN